MTTKKILAAVVVLLILTIAIGVGIYNNVEELKAKNFSATLEARKAIEAHDLETFEKYVDVDELLNQAAAQILTAHINATLNPTAYSMDELQTRYENILKPDFVKSARAAVDEYIKTGKVTFPTEMTDAQEFFKKSDIASCEIKSITKPRLEGHVQTATVTFYNPYMKFSFDLELELTSDTEGNWRITDAKGFEEYYLGWRRSLRRKLDSLNAPIVHQLDEIFSVKSFKAKVDGGDEYGFSENLAIEITADVHSDKPLAKIIGNVILGKDDRESFAPFAIDMTGNAQGLQIFNVTKTLNPFVRADSNAMRHGFSKKDIRIEVTEIIFADGTSLKQYDQLPE